MNEALYIPYNHEPDGTELSGSKRFTLTFDKTHLPPVNAFWSITMYDKVSLLLVENPINRYLINDSMLNELKSSGENNDKIVLYLQSDSPGAENESNWLPTPPGRPFYILLRLYLPKQEALDGTWEKPELVEVKNGD